MLTLVCENSKDNLVVPAELGNALNKYIAASSLVNPNDASYISLDERLSQALLKKGEHIDFMPRSQVLERLLSGMQAWYRTTSKEYDKEEETLNKGVAKKISIAVKRRQGKKVVTIVEGQLRDGSSSMQH